MLRSESARAAVAITAAGSLLAGGCAAPDEGSGAVAITYLEPQFFRTLYPPEAGFYPNGAVVNNIADRLLYQDPETLELHPWLATDLPEVNDDATEFTFTIRDDVTFSDGSPLTPETVVKNFDLFADGDDSRTLSGSEQITNYSHGEVLDDHTVRFHFDKPEPGFVQATSSFNAGILSDETLDFDSEGFGPGNATNVVATGPFVVAEEDLGTRLVLRARDDYDWAPEARDHSGRPEIDEVHYVLAAEDSVRVGAVRSGQADIAREIPAPEEPLLEEYGVDVQAYGTNGMNNQIAFRFTHPKLQDIRVRRALIAAIDREEVLYTLFSDSYPLAASAMARTAAGYKEQEGAYTYDPELAERLLDEAGWTRQGGGLREKDGETLEFTINEALPQPRSREVVTKIQEQLARIGVGLHLNPGDQAAQDSDSKDKEKIELRHTMVGRADFDVIVSLYHRDKRNALLNDADGGDEPADPELQRLLEAVTAEPDLERRAEITGKVQDHLTKNAYILPLFEEPVVYAVAPGIEGLSDESIGRPNFYEVTVDEAERSAQ